MSEIVSDLKKLDKTSIAAAIIVFLLVIGLIATLVVLIKRPSSSDKATVTPTRQTTTVSKTDINPPAQASQDNNTQAANAEPAPTNTQTSAPATEANNKPEAAANVPADTSLPAGLAVLTALDPDRFSGDAYQVSELRYGNGNIYGTVKSNTQEMFNNITLEITLYDANQAATGVCTVKLTGVKPGSSTKFVKEIDSGPCASYRVTGYIAS